MRPTVSFLIRSLLGGAVVAAAAPSVAHADPLGIALRMVRLDQPGAGTPTARPAPTPSPLPTSAPVKPAPAPAAPVVPGAPAGAVPTPAATTPTTTASLFGELTGPAETASLPALLEGAVQSEPTLAEVRINREIAEIAIARAQAWREWTIDATAAGAIRSSIGSDERSLSLQGTVGRRIFTGGTLSLTASSDWGRTVRTVEVAGVELEQSQAGYTEAITATYSQPLLRGRGDLELLAAERAARFNRDAAAIAQDAAVIGVVQELVLAYFDLTQAERVLAIRRSSLELTSERKRVTEAGINAGGTARAELIAVEQSIATREEEILSAELSIIEQSLALRRQTGLAIAPGQMLLTTSVELAIPDKRWDARALLDAAVANSPELARLRALEAGATIEIEVSEHGTLPSLDLALSFGPSGSDTNPGSAAVNMATFDAFTAAVSLTYRDTIGRTAAKATAREARARRQLVRVNSGDVERQLALAITRATTQVIAAERRHAIATRAVELAEQNLAAEQARLTSGKSRNVDVLERQDELRASQLRVAQAILDWHRADTIISGLTGELLPQYGVTVR